MDTLISHSLRKDPATKAVMTGIYNTITREKSEEEKKTVRKANIGRFMSHEERDMMYNKRMSLHLEFLHKTWRIKNWETALEDLNDDQCIQLLNYADRLFNNSPDCCFVLLQRIKQVVGKDFRLLTFQQWMEIGCLLRWSQDTHEKTTLWKEMNVLHRCRCASYIGLEHLIPLFMASDVNHNGIFKFSVTQAA
jgi:hypothetical protein